MAGRKPEITSVKFASGLSEPFGNVVTLREAKKAAASANDGAPSAVAGADPNSIYPPPRRYRIKQPWVIRTGPLVGLRMRRPTDRRRALTVAQVADLANAHAFARKIGLPPNGFLTIAWTLAAGFDDNAWPAMQTVLFDRLTRFLRCRGIVTAYTWVRERVPGRGHHTHAMIHLGSRPPALRLELPAYLNSRFGFAAGGVDLDVGGFGMHTEAMQAGRLRYMVKAIDHAAFRYHGTETENIGALLGIDHRGGQGVIAIKRAGTSQNIGRAARKRADWQEIRELEKLASVINPKKPGADMAQAA